MVQPVHPSLDAAFLDFLAGSLAGAIADNGGGVLVHVAPRPDGPDIAVLPLDGLAPAEVLLGFVAPPDWAVLGVATTGWARMLDQPSRRTRAEIVVLVVRDGRVVGRVRHGDQLITEPPACGITLDCLQRALGLPTPAPAEAGADWARLRELAVAGHRPELGVSPEDAAWFDDGSFSRWVADQRRALSRRSSGAGRTPGAPRPATARRRR